MKDRFSVGRCCCGCTDCCNGNAPEEFDVDFDWTDNLCTSCDEEVGGTTTLSRVSGEICSWQFLRAIGSGWTTPCKPDYATYDNEFTRQEMRLDIRCNPAGDAYNVTLWSQLNFNYDTGVEYDPWTGVAWQTRNFSSSIRAFYGWPTTSIIPPFAEFICDEVQDVELQFKYAFLSWQFEFFWPAANNWFVRRESYSAISTTALPIGSRTFPANLFFGYPFTWIGYPICEPPATAYITGVP
jgi:hypothetical protein